MSNKFSIKDIQKTLKKTNPWGNVISKSDFAKITDYIGTGNYLLNAVISADLFKGIPNNRSVSLAGPSQTGKTYILLSICKQALEVNKYDQIIFYDTEGAVSDDMIEDLGIDTDKFWLQPIESLESFRTSITNLTNDLKKAQNDGKEIPKILVMLDSLGMLATSKEIDDAITGSDKTDMTRAKTIRSIFRIITLDLTGLKIPLIYTNHTYASMSLFSSQNLSGGGGVEYAPSVTLILGKAQLKDDSKNQSGILVHIKPHKNRMAKPKRATIHIHWKTGLNPYIGLQDFVSWDVCGIDKGDVLTEGEFEKERMKARCKQFEHNGEILYFKPKSTAKYYTVKHLGKIVEPKDFFTSDVFTKEVLTNINEKVIKPTFTYGTNEDVIEDLVNIEIEDEE